MYDRVLISLKSAFPKYIIQVNTAKY